MTIEEQLACVHPMLYEHELNGEWIYSIGGTGFLVSVETEVYFITARHCLEKIGAKPEQVSIFPCPGSRDFVPFDVLYSATADDPEDQDYADFVILHMKAELMSHEDRTQVTQFALTDATVVEPDGLLDAFIARGFPTELNVPDYDVRSIPRHSFTFQPNFTQKAEEKHSFIFSWPNKNTIKSPDGLSGSPLFGLRKTSDGRYMMSLAGMFIRGGNSILRCIDARVLWEAFRVLRK